MSLENSSTKSDQLVRPESLREMSGDRIFGTSIPESSVMPNPNVHSQRETANGKLKKNRTIPVIATIIFVFLLAGATWWFSRLRHKDPQPTSVNDKYEVTNLSIDSTGKSSTSLGSGGYSSVAINGNMNVGGSLRLVPTSRPASPAVGQQYVDVSDNKLYLYNGSDWIAQLNVVDLSAINASVQNLQVQNASIANLANTTATNIIQSNSLSSLNGVSNNGGNVDIVGVDGVIITPDTIGKKISISAPASSGDISNVTAGDGLSGGGASGSVSLAVDSSVARRSGSGADNQTFSGNNQLFQNTSNSTTAFQIQNAAGTSNLFVADTTNNRIGIGKVPTNGKLDVNGSGYFAGSLNLTGADNQGLYTGYDNMIFGVDSDNNGLGDLYNFYGNGTGTPILKFSNNGSATFRNQTDSTTAFQIQNAAGTSNLLVADTTNNRIGIGTAAPANTLSIGTLASPNPTARAAISMDAANNVGLVIQGYAGQAVSDFFMKLQDSSGDTKFSVDIYGQARAVKSYILTDYSEFDGKIMKRVTVGTGGISSYDVIVMANDGGASRALRSSTARDTRVYGVSNSTLAAGGVANVVIAGNYLVNVDTVAVAIGDQLVVSSTAGLATVDNSATTGIIGYATGAKAGGANGTVSLRVQPSGGQYSPRFQNTIDSTTAFQIQNAAGTSNLFVADTTNNRIGIGTNTPGYNLHVVGVAGSSTELRIQSDTSTSLTLQNTSTNSYEFSAGSDGIFRLSQNGVITRFNLTGAGNASFGSSNLGYNLGVSGTLGATGNAYIQGGSLTVGTTAQQGSLMLYDGSSNTATIQSAALSANATYQFADAAAGTYNFCTTASVCNGYQASGSYFVQGGNSFGATAILGTSDSYGLVFQTGGTQRISIISTGTTTITSGTVVNPDALIVSNSTSTGSILKLRDNATDVVTVADGGGVIFRNSVDSASAFQVQDSGGTQILGIGSSDRRVSIGQVASPAAKLNVNTGSEIAMRINQTSTNDILQLRNSGTDVLTVNNEGHVLSKNTTNSTTAFQIQNAAGTSNLFIADTANDRIGIGKVPTSFSLDINGLAGSSGGFVLSNAASNNGRIAKVFLAGTGGVSANDLVVFADNGGALRVVRTSTARDNRVAGVAVASVGSDTSVEVAVSGTYQVTADTAAVAIGDQLVASGTSGQVTVDNSATTGVLGMALSTKSAGASGLVSVSIRPVAGQYNPIFRNSVNSTTAFQIQNSGGTNYVFNADTTNVRIGIGTNAPTGTLDIRPSAIGELGLFIKQYASTTADILQFQNSSSVTVFNIDASGHLASGESLPGVPIVGVDPNSGADKGDMVNNDGPLKAWAGSGLTLNIAAGSAYSADASSSPTKIKRCNLASNTTLSMADNATRYIYALAGGADSTTGTTCTFSQGNTPDTFNASKPTVVIAKVVTSGGAITSVSDTRFFIGGSLSYVQTAAAVEPGMIVKVDTGSDNQVQTTTSAADTGVEGIIVIGNTGAGRAIMMTSGMSWTQAVSSAIRANCAGASTTAGLINNVTAAVNVCVGRIKTSAAASTPSVLVQVAPN